MIHTSTARNSFSGQSMARSDPQMKIRMPEDLKRAIEEEAEKRKRTLNAEIVHRLSRSFEGEAAMNAIPELFREIAEYGSQLSFALQKSGKLEERILESHAEILQALSDRSTVEAAAKRETIVNLRQQFFREFERLNRDSLSRSEIEKILSDVNLDERSSKGRR